MKVTNKHGLPETVIRAIQDDEYSRGDAMLSVTQIISPPRIVLLQNLNAENLEVDAVDRVYALFGSAVHKVIEKGSKDLPGHIVEERLFAEVEGWKISGAVDLQIQLDDGTWEINDYKVTSVYSVMSVKPEWEQQLNCYAYLMRVAHGREVSKLKIIAILRDWQGKSADTKQGYPAAQIVVVDIPVWSPEDQQKYVFERVRLHQIAKKSVDSNESPPYCTDEERWLRDTTWAVMKEGRKSAVKLHGNQEDADTHARELGPGHRVEHRPGTPTRCTGDYCTVARFCRQHQDYLAGVVSSTG